MTSSDQATAAARVLVCDDSVVIRAALARLLEANPGVRVVARAANGQQAIEAVRRTPIDVVLLDVEMPVMDGLSALPLLLEAAPGLRVIMASTATTRGAEATLRALQLGAADYIPKPSALVGLGGEAFRRELLAKVTGLAHAPRQPTAAQTVGGLRPAGLERPELLAIGCSTGGPQALFALIPELAGALPVPVVVTQHMPPTFTATLAAHIGRLSGVTCAEAADGERLLAGQVYVAPGGRHLTIEAFPDGLRARLLDTPPVNYCRPAVDPMLKSAATATCGRMLVAILTGMGQDGLIGTRDVIEAGGTALAQDEATSVVWGMPGAVAQAGLCHAVLPLPQIAPRLLELLGVTPPSAIATAPSGAAADRPASSGRSGALSSVDTQ